MTIETIEAAQRRPLVAIESPYAGDVRVNEEFARRACRYAVDEGYAPFAMHLFYTQFLDDQSAAERNIGIGCGLAWTANAAEVWFCLREGEELTPGMRKALDAERKRIKTPQARPIRNLVFSVSGNYLRG